MNAEARALGLRDTIYRTPHGLDEPGAHSSAHDVLTLARLDMTSPVFRSLARRQSVTIRATRCSRRATRCSPPTPGWTG